MKTFLSHFSEPYLGLRPRLFYGGPSALKSGSVGVLTQSSSLPFSGAYGTGGALVFVP